MQSSTTPKLRILILCLLQTIGLVSVDEVEIIIEKELRVIESKLGYLMSCDDYLVKKAYDAIEYISNLLAVFADHKYFKSVYSRMIDCLLEGGLLQLVMKSVESTVKRSCEFRYLIGATVGYLTCPETAPPNIASHVTEELCKIGIIQKLVEELDSYDPHTTDPGQLLCICSTLCNLCRMQQIPNAVSVSRAANAVNAVMSFIDSDDTNVTILAARVLSYIVNENECQRFGKHNYCISMILGVLQKATRKNNVMYRFVIKTDRKYNFITRIRLLTQAMNNLASYDVMKEVILQHGGVPILSSMLRPEYADDVKQEVVECLWKLSFIESREDVIYTHFNRDSIHTHLKHTDTQALEGKPNIDSKFMHSAEKSHF